MDCSPLLETLRLLPQRAGLIPTPKAFSLPQASSRLSPVAVPPPTRCPSVAWLLRTWPSCMCVPLPPNPVLPVDPPRSRAWFSLLSLPGPPPSTRTPWSLFSFSLSFQKRGQLCSPPGDGPTSSNSECRKETGPPSEARLASRTLCYSGTSPWTEWAGGSAAAHPDLRSAMPARLPPAGQNWCSPRPRPRSRGQGTLPASRPSHFDGVCDISCCEVKEGPLRPAPFSCSLLVRVSIFPLVRLSSKQVMVEGSHAGQLQTPASLRPLLLSLRTAGPPSAPSA